VQNPVFNEVAEPDSEINIRYRPSLHGYDSLHATPSMNQSSPDQQGLLSQTDLQHARDAEDFWIADVDRLLSQTAGHSSGVELLHRHCCFMSAPLPVVAFVHESHNYNLEIYWL
jgi:hypothetical protein